jgi:hypothetical protein
MRTWADTILDEKVITCIMIILFSLGVILLIKWNADKEYVAIFGGPVSMLVGSLLRGLFHVPQQTDSTQTVSSTTTITPKE